jgi:hypothetical protein
MLKYGARYSASLFWRLALCCANEPFAGVLPRQQIGRV